MPINVNAGSVSVGLQLLTTHFDRSLAGASRRLAMLGRRMPRLHLPALLGLGAGGAAGSFLGVAARLAATYETRLAELRKVTAGTAEETARLGDKLQRIAQTTPISSADIFSIATFGSRMGIAGSQLATFTKSISGLKLALSDLPVQEATEKLARLASVTGLGSGSIRAMGSTLVALDQASTASARDILDITSRFVGMGRALHMPIEQMMALAAATREAGVTSEVAGTSLSQLLGRMAESRTRRKFAALAGMPANVFEGVLRRRPLEALTMVGRGIAGMDPIKAVDALSKMGIQGQRARQVLLGLSFTYQKLGQFVRIGNREMSTAAAVARSEAIAAATLGGQWTLLSNRIEVAAAAIGKTLLPAFKELAKGVGDAFDDIKGWAAENQEDLTRWGRALGQGFRDVIGVVRNFDTVWAHAAANIELTWSNLQEGADQTVTLIARAFTGIVVAQQTLFNDISANARAYFANTKAWLGTAIPALTRFVVDLVGQLGTAVKVQLNNMIADFPDIFKAIIGMSFPQLKQAMRALKHQEMPAVKPDFGLFRGVGAGMVKAPGFANPLAPFAGIGANLPDRRAERDAIRARFAQVEEGHAAGHRARQVRKAAEDEEERHAERMARALKTAAGAMKVIIDKAPTRKELEAQARRLRHQFRDEERARHRRAIDADEARRKNLGAPPAPLPPGIREDIQNEKDRLKARQEEVMRGIRGDLQNEKDRLRARQEDVMRGIRGDAQNEKDRADAMRKRILDEQKARDAEARNAAKARAKANQAFVPGPMGQMLAMAMVGGLRPKPMPSDREPRRERGAKMREPRRTPDDIKAEAAFRAEMARINAANNFGVATTPRKAGQVGFSAGAGGGQGAGRGVGALNMIGDLVNPIMNWSGLIGGRIGEAMYNRTIELNRRPIPAAEPRDRRAAPMSEATAIKMIASIEANTQAHNKLLQPGKMLGHWD